MTWLLLRFFGKSLCIILYHTMQAISTQGCMCRIDTGLARKADTWYSGCTKKVMFQKHTGTAILLKWLTTVTVHEGAMSFIHYRTLRANPLFRVFHPSCIRHVWYNRFPFRWVLGLVVYWGEKGGSSSKASSAQTLPHLKCAADLSPDVIPCRWAGPTGGATAQAAFTNHRVTSRVQCILHENSAHDGQEWNTKK